MEPEKLEALVVEKIYALKTLQRQYFSYTGVHCPESIFYVDCRIAAQVMREALILIGLDLIFIVIDVLIEPWSGWRLLLLTIPMLCVVIYLAVFMLKLSYEHCRERWDSPLPVRYIYRSSPRTLKLLTNEISKVKRLIDNLPTQQKMP